MLLNVQREMKILTWNINGIRAARRGKPLKEVLDSLEADVICLQETKVTRDMLDEVTAIVDGYNAYFSFSKVKTGYSGVATFCRDAVTPVAAEEGLSSSLTSQPSIGCYGSNSDFTVDELEALDAEGRAILTEHRFPDGKNVVIINVYCPRADKENKDRVNFKLRFYKLLQERAESLVKAERHVIVLGDINTAHKMIDHCEPDEEKTFNTNPGRQWLNQFLVPSDESCNTVEDTHELLQTTEKLFIDTFRWFHPTQCGAYTNWCTVTSARQTNYGTRIDYIFADVELVKKELIDCVIRPDIDGSDHCPVIAILKTSFQGASKPPAPCTKYMPEFAGKQQKLKSYFVKHSEQAQSSSQPNSNSVTSKSQEGTSMKRSASFGDEKSKVKRQKTGVKTKADSQPKTNLFSFFSRPSNSVSSQRKAPDLNSENGCENIHVSHVTSKTMHPNKSSSTLETGISASVDRTTSFTDENLRESNTSKPAHTNKDSMTLESDNSASDECTTSFIEEVAPSNTTMTSKDCPQKRKAEAALWKSILTGPRPPPLCSSHKEPCALRTVKAKGPNQGKQFYCCARPQGHSSNPQARCNFFKWVK